VDLPSGDLVLRFGIATEALGRLGTVSMPVTVQDRHREDVKFSALVVGLGAGQSAVAENSDVLRGLVPFQPVVQRAFPTSTPVRVFARAFWKASASTSLQLQHGGGPYIFSERLLEDRLVECQIRDDAPKATILVAQLPHLAQLAHAEIAVLFFSAEERALRDAKFATDVLDRCPGFRLSEGDDDLLFGEPALAHWPCLLPVVRASGQGR